MKSRDLSDRRREIAKLWLGGVGARRLAKLQNISVDVAMARIRDVWHYARMQEVFGCDPPDTTSTSHALMDAGLTDRQEIMRRHVLGTKIPGIDKVGIESLGRWLESPAQKDPVFVEVTERRKLQAELQRRPMKRKRKRTT